jgi:hypothetical protein
VIFGGAEQTRIVLFFQMRHQGGYKMTGGQAPYIAELGRDNDKETPVRHGEFALLPQAAERRPGGYCIGPQNVNRLFGVEAVSPPCDQIRYVFRCSHGLPSQMNCSGKVTHFVTLVERYLPPASRNSGQPMGNFMAALLAEQFPAGQRTRLYGWDKWR